MSSKTQLQTHRTGIITGASSGIGRALAIKLAERFQSKLVLNARNVELLKEAENLVRAAGGEAVAIPGDISEKKIAHKLTDTCLSRFGSIDLIVNNAGLVRPGAVPRITPDDWHKVFGVNFFGPLYLIYAALPYLLEHRAGKIVNVASVAGKVPLPGTVCYAASKFAMVGMSEGMAAEFTNQGIDVVTVCPGFVRTEFYENNQVPPDGNLTFLASKRDFTGWLVKYGLSISAEQTADDIIKACQKGGPQEIILTGPGIVVDRLKRFLPSLMFEISKHIGGRIISILETGWHEKDPETLIL